MSQGKGSVGALRYIASAAGALTLAAAGILITVPAAYAEDGMACTPSDAWDEQVLVTPAVPPTDGTPAVTHFEYQRYSWTLAGKEGGDGPGDSTPMSNPDDWQANTTNYEGAGHGTDPIGVAFHQGEGNGSWFFWTKTEVVDTPAVPGTEGSPAIYDTVHHDAVTCPTDEVKPPTETPPAMTPPAMTPLVEPTTTHTLPTTVQTDGDTTWIPIAAGGLGALAAVSLAGAGLLMRGRRS